MMPIIPQKFHYFAVGPFNMEGKKLQCFAKNETEFQPFLDTLYGISYILILQG